MVLKAAIQFASALAAVAYVCQYAIVKSASSRQALIWLGCQGVLAAIRVVYWTLDPSFDDSFANCGEYAMLSNTGSDHVTLTELICATTGDSPVIISAWVLSYFTEHSMRDILRQAASK